MSVQLIPLADIRPNPFRFITEYSLSETKIEELVESIQDTGFWTNVCARPVNGHYEIAYGHHRIEAARRANLSEVPLVIERDMTDERAFELMKRENSEAYGTSAAADAGVIAGLISGCIEGRLKVDRVHPKTPRHTIYMARKEKGKIKIYQPQHKEVRDAMSAHRERTSAQSLIFTTYTLAKNLGWVRRDELNNEDGQRPSRRFDAAFKVLTELILPEAVLSKELEGMTQKDVVKVAIAAGVVAHKARMEGKNSAVFRRKAAKEAIEKLQSEGLQKDREKKIRQAANRALPKKPREIPTIEKYAEKFIAECRNAPNPYWSILKKGDAMLPFLDDLDDAMAARIADAVEHMKKRFENNPLLFIAAFRSKNRPRIRKLITEGR
jgi:hypothetical protein